MTTYVGGGFDKEHIAERKVAEHLERLARQAISELSVGTVCTALGISVGRRDSLLAESDWPLLRGLRICFLLGALDPRVFEQALDEATDPDLMILHLPHTLPPDIPYTPPPPFAAVPPSPLRTTTTATTTPPPPVVLSAPTMLPLYRTDDDGLLSHIIGYAMKGIESVSVVPPDLPEPMLMMDGTVLAPSLPLPTRTYVELTLAGLLTATVRSHPYPNDDVGRLVLLLREFRARTGRGPTLRVSA